MSWVATDEIIDDVAARRAAHAGEDELGERPGAVDVRAPERSGSRGSVSATVWPRDATPALADQDVDRSELGDHALDHGGALLVVADVGGVRAGAAAERLDVRDGRPRADSSSRR